jgi:8-oxo-dGTP pyrophosphatase MutT (NUDIX family)
MTAKKGARKKAKAPAARAAKEHSAGGVVRRPLTSGHDLKARPGGKPGRGTGRGCELLIVKVENLQGRVVWTFPKGHLEKGETAEQAALREVREETGWQCRLGKRFGKAQYRFQRGGRKVFKTVDWFLMEPVAREGEADPAEILDVRWCSLAEARELLTYDSDKAILKRLK